jgi:hypothetical protein
MQAHMQHHAVTSLFPDELSGAVCAHILFYNRGLDELTSFNLRAFPSAREADLAMSRS